MPDLSPEPQPLPDPGKIQPRKSKKKQVTRYILAAAGAVFVLSFLLGTCTPKVPAPGTRKAVAKKQAVAAPKVEEPDPHLMAELSACSLQLAERQAKTGVPPPKLSEDNPKLALTECQALIRIPLPADVQAATSNMEQTQTVQREKTVAEQIQEERRRREEASLFAHSAVITNSRQSAQKETVERSEPAERETVKTTPVVALQPKLRTVDPATATEILPEGTMIECGLVTELNGENASVVKIIVANDVYAPGTRTLVIPQGSIILGEAQRVANQNQQRLAVFFHRLIIGTGHNTYWVPLDKAPGLDLRGVTALHDKVDNHYFQIFGASLAIGAVGGLAQIGNSYGGYGYDPSVQFRNGVTQSMAMSSEHILDRFLNRMPTVIIRANTPVYVWLTGDLALPEYEAPSMKLEPTTVAQQ